MKEKDLTTIVNSSFKKCENCWVYKIPDPPKGSATASSKRPFDVFGYTDKYNFVIELKLIKSNLGSFNFNIIEEHQLYNLTFINKIVNLYSDDQFYIGYGIGYFIPRKLFVLFLFENSTIQYLINKGITSLKKPIITALYEAGFYMPIKRQNNIYTIFNLKDNIIEKNINIDIIQNYL